MIPREVWRVVYEYHLNAQVDRLFLLATRLREPWQFGPPGEYNSLVCTLCGAYTVQHLDAQECDQDRQWNTWGGPDGTDGTCC